MKFEHSYHVDRAPWDLGVKLREQSEYGWELVSVTSRHSGATSFDLFWKRPVE